MKEVKVFNEFLSSDGAHELTKKIHDFDSIEGGVSKRNVIKNIIIEDKLLNIKSFKIPNIINQIVYKFFRKSKAQRSFEYANKLLSLGVQTPNPIAYFEYTSIFLFKKSYYISLQLECDLTYRELIHQPDYPDSEAILKAFTRFTYDLHEKGILFKDHSPGNTLISKLGNNEYQFSLVDLNRMDFKPLSYKERIDNFKRLTPKKEMVSVMSKEYAKLIGRSYDEIFDEMWASTQAFQKKFHGKKAFKEKWFFWRKKK